jgi:hypothetical protein
MLKNVFFKAQHIFGKDNPVADALSRQQFTRFRQEHPQADEVPSPIPDLFRQMLLNMNLQDY